MARFYTVALRIPQLIGRTPDGTKLPFGPYTIPQMVVGAVAAVVLWNTTALWARFGLIGNLVLAAGLLFAAVWGTGRMPPGLRNPLVIVGGWIHAIGRVGATAPMVQLRKPRVVRGQVSMFTDGSGWVEPAADEDPAPQAAESPKPARTRPELPHVNEPAQAGLPVLTGVQRLLAQTTPH